MKAKTPSGFGRGFAFTPKFRLPQKEVRRAYYRLREAGAALSAAAASRVREVLVE